MKEKIQNPFCGGVMLHNLPSSRLEGITKPDHPLRERVGLQIYKSDNKMFFELTKILINKEKWKERDVDASGFQQKYYLY